MTLVRRFRSCEAGSAGIEFALVGLTLLLVAFGLIEFGRGLNARNQLSLAADYGARAILTNSLVSNTALDALVRSHFTAGRVSQLVVTFGNEVVAGTTYRTIVLAYPFTPSVAGLSNQSIQLSVVRRIPQV